MSVTHMADWLASTSKAPANPPATQTITELGQRGQFCGVMYVARQLRLTAVDIRTVVHHIRAHIHHSGFPAPVTSRLRAGMPVHGADAVTPKSEWLRVAVDAWIDARYAGALPDGLRPDAARTARVDAILAERFTGKHPA